MLLERPCETESRETSVACIADDASAGALLTCFIREIALPRGWVRHEWQRVDAEDVPPEPTGTGVPLLLSLSLPNGAAYHVLVDRYDAFARHRYVSSLYGRDAGGRWQRLDFADFAHDLLTRFAGIEAVNSELLGQILASRDTMAEILREAEATVPEPLADYMTSERTLWFGHPVHPAPKARGWADPTDERRFAPEFGATFRLHRWEVAADGLAIRANGLGHADVLAAVADQAGAPAGRAILSLHPAQARMLLRDDRVRAALASGQIRDLGATGVFARALASVRTLALDRRDHLLKTSLAIRITNCVRKNAWYELESAVVIDRLLAALPARDPDGCGGLATIAEPASLSWAPGDADAADACWFREHTGMILRRDFRLDHAEDAALACTLFGRDTRLAPLISGFVGSDADAGRRWFADYARLLLRPMLTAFFRHGVVFEPHLQNCVVLHRDRVPVRVLVRDFEGVKLTEEQGMRLLDDDVPAEVRASLAYSRERGWQRVAYCLFVNNLSEAVLALSWDDPALAPELWRIVADTLRTIRAGLDCDAPELDAAIAGGPIPCKANFCTRLAAAPDREAGYIALDSPWSTAR